MITEIYITRPVYVTVSHNDGVVTATVHAGPSDAPGENDVLATGVTNCSEALAEKYPELLATSIRRAADTAMRVWLDQTLTDLGVPPHPQPDLTKETP